MKTTIRFFLALLLTGAVAHAEPQSLLTVAVYDFKGDTAAAIYANNVTTLLTANLTAETNLLMVERAVLAKALKEQAFGLSGMVSPDTASQIGQITGAKVLISGQVIKTSKDHVIIVANLIGTETGRLFADKVDGATDNLTELTSDLSHKIAQTIGDQTTNLVSAAQESSTDRLDRIIKSITDTNRPSVSVRINNPQGNSRPNVPANTEFGRILLKAGFPVADKRSDRKPDIEITGMSDGSSGPHKDGMFTFQDIIELKVQDRRSGKIITLEHQVAFVTDASRKGAQRAAIIKAIDTLAERVLPLLAK